MHSSGGPLERGWTGGSGEQQSATGAGGWGGEASPDTGNDIAPPPLALRGLQDTLTLDPPRLATGEEMVPRTGLDSLPGPQFGRTGPGRPSEGSGGD